MSLWLAAGVIVASVAGMIALMLGLRRIAPEGGHFKDSDRASGVLGFIGSGFAILLGFVILLTFQSYSSAKSKSEDEATAVFEQYNVSELFQPAERRHRIQGKLVCYARSVVYQEWPAMKGGNRSPVTDGWIESFERDVPAVNITTMGEDVAYQKWFDKSSERDDARRQRLLEAKNVLPTLLWAMLIIGALAVLGFVLLYADPRERVTGQAMFIGGVTAVIVPSLLAVALLASPFQNQDGSIKPSSMRYTLQLISDEAGQLGDTFRPPCDEQGRPAGQSS